MQVLLKEPPRMNYCNLANVTEKCKGEAEIEVVEETRRNGRDDLGKDRGAKLKSEGCTNLTRL
jgi:hypothetical protein